jgi:hypothetical protein
VARAVEEERLWWHARLLLMEVKARWRGTAKEETRRSSGGARAVEMKRRCERVRHGAAEERNSCGGVVARRG